SGGSSNRAVSPNGKIRVELVGELDKDRQGALGSDNRGPLAVVETDEGKGGPEGNYRSVVAAALSPDGKLLARGSRAARSCSGISRRQGRRPSAGQERRDARTST